MLRRLVLVLLFLSAPLVGALSAATQARDVATVGMGLHRLARVAAEHHASGHDASGHDVRCEARQRCDLPTKPLHPVLCAACLAISPAQSKVTPPETSSSRLSLRHYTAPDEENVRPPVPPPKPFLSI
ncbi:hypothetical protein I6F07_09645 [Ensifer sp. IC4062]|nr:hypothetical protein [Ensifer sp. IC4062]MCA1440472.1 hypothetical protein [Ensifer sp. IC4062]